MKYWRTADLDNVPNYLMHHGVSGQRWGIKHGPPYPLDSNISTGKKLRTKDMSAEAIGIASVLAMYSVPLSIAAGTAIKNKHDKRKYNNAHDEYRKNYKEYESHFGEQAKKIGKGDKETIDACKKEGDPKKVTKKDLQKINAYGMENPKGNHNKVDKGRRYEDSNGQYVFYKLKRASYGRDKNCPNCSTAFILNKLGWALNAAPVFKHGRTSKEIFDQNKAMFKGYTRDTVLTKADFKSALNAKPDNTFGSFDFNYRSATSGHILNWAKENGTVYIYDAQNATKMSLNRFINKYDPDFGGSSYIFDMTDSTINWDKVAEYKYTY